MNFLQQPGEIGSLRQIGQIDALAHAQELDANRLLIGAVVDVAVQVDVEREGEGHALAQIDGDGIGLGVVLKSYVCGVLEGQCRQALTAEDFVPSCGFLHSDKQ